MKKLSFYKVIMFCFIACFITSCGNKKYSFTVDAPPEYSSQSIFKKIKIKPFKSNRRQDGHTIMTLLKSGIAKEGYVNVVQSHEECLLNGELNIGKIHTNSSTENHKCTKYSNGHSYQTTCYSYLYNKKLFVKVDYTLQNSKNGNVIYGDSVNYNFDQTWSSSKSRSEARAQALTDDQIINTAISQISRRIVSAVTPHRETISRELEEGHNDNVKLGITYLTHGRIDQAIAIWDQCIKNSVKTTDKAAAYYNIGVIKESQGAYKDAFELYSKANLLLPAKELYIESMSRAEALNKNDQRLKKWKK